MSGWPEALEKLKAIDVVDVIPGLRLAAQTRNGWDSFKEGALHDEKLFPSATAKCIDMTAHKPHQATIDSPGVDVPTVSRMFAAMDHWAGQ